MPSHPPTTIRNHEIFLLLKNTQLYKDKCGNLFVLLSLENENYVLRSKLFSSAVSARAKLWNI